MPLASTQLKSLGGRCFQRFLNTGLAVASLGTRKEIARRNAERGHDALRWFTPEEATVAEALAGVIVPSDEDTPGMEEVGVLGAPAIVTLDNIVTASPERQRLYSRGLLSFDTWALRKSGFKFADMPQEEQVALLRAAQRLHERWTERRSSIGKMWHGLRAIARVRDGAFFAAELYPQLRDDCLRVFYTSRVSWVWLGYDGPPMDKGYPNVVVPRAV